MGEGGSWQKHMPHGLNFEVWLPSQPIIFFNQ